MLPIVAIVAGLLWTCARATPTGEHTCTGVVKHPVTVLVNVTEPVTYRSYTWCLRVPPRCSKYTVLLKDRIKVHTEMHNRTITVCCSGYVEVEYRCVPACPQEVTCPFMHCNRTNHCYCSPGYTGLYCSQPCQRGVWGKDCKKLCDCPADYTCHHLTGDCFEDETLRRTTKAPKTTTKSTTTTRTERTLPTIQQFTTTATTLETVKTPVFEIPPPPYVPPTKRPTTTTTTSTQVPVTRRTPMTTSAEIEKVIEGIFLTSPITLLETTVSPIEIHTSAVTSGTTEVQTSPTILDKTIKTPTYTIDGIKFNENIQLTKELIPVTTTETPSKREKTTKLYIVSEISTLPKLRTTMNEVSSTSGTVPSNVLETVMSKSENVTPHVTKSSAAEFQTSSKYPEISETHTSPYQSSTKLYTETIERKMTKGITTPATIVVVPREKTVMNTTNSIFESEVYTIPEMTSTLETSATPSTTLISEKGSYEVFKPPEMASTEISEKETMFDGKIKEMTTIGTTVNLLNTKVYRSSESLATTPNTFSNENFISTTIRSTTVSPTTESREVLDPLTTNMPISTIEQKVTKIDILPPTIYTSVEKVRKKQYDKPKQANKVNPFKELSQNVTLSKRSTENPTLQTVEITKNYETETTQTSIFSNKMPSTDSTSTTKNKDLMKTVSLEETTISHLTQHKDYKQNIQHLAEKSLKETFSPPKLEVPHLKESSATEDGTIIESNTISSFLHTFGENTDFKHFPSKQEDNSYSVESNKIKFNISKTVAAGVTSSKEGNILNTLTTMSLMLGVGLTTLMFLSATIWIYFKRKNKILIYESQHMVCPSPDPLIYDLGSVDVAGMEQTTFFCPTFTNNYAERINRELNELNYDHPRSSFSEPLYEEIRY